MSNASNVQLSSDISPVKESSHELNVSPSLEEPLMEESYVWKKKMASKRKYGQIPAQNFSKGKRLINLSSV